METCLSMVIHCCCSLRRSIWLLVTACPCLSLVPASKVLNEHSISCSCGDIVYDKLAEVVVSGLEAFKDGWKRSLMMYYQCHWYWYSLNMSCQLMGNLQRHRRLTSGGLRIRLQASRLRVTGCWLWLSEV